MSSAIVRHKPRESVPFTVNKYQQPRWVCIDETLHLVTANNADGTVGAVKFHGGTESFVTLPAETQAIHAWVEITWREECQ